MAFTGIRLDGLRLELFNKAKGVLLPHNWEPLKQVLSGPEAVNVCEALENYFEKLHLQTSCKATLCAYERSIGIHRHPIYGVTHNYRPTLTFEQKDQLDKVANEHTYTAVKESQQRRVLFCCIYGEDYRGYDCDSRADEG